MERVRCFDINILLHVSGSLFYSSTGPLWYRSNLLRSYRDDLLLSGSEIRIYCSECWTQNHNNSSAGKIRNVNYGSIRNTTMDLITYIDSILCYCTLGVEPSGEQPASVTILCLTGLPPIYLVKWVHHSVLKIYGQSSQDIQTTQLIDHCPQYKSKKC